MSRTACVVASVLLITLFALSGCTHYYDPIAYPIKPEMVPEFRSNHVITLENVQKAKKELIGSMGGHKWMGDLYNWTDAAIKLLKAEMEKRNMKVSGGAEKLLKLSVHRANIYQGFWVIRCIVYLKVETGDGYTNDFEGNNTGANVFRASNGAITKAVAAMLSNETILAYITK